MMKNNKQLSTLAVITPVSAYAFDGNAQVSPIAGVFFLMILVVLAIIFISWACKKPIAAIAMVFSFCAAIVVGFGIPAFVFSQFENDFIHILGCILGIASGLKTVTLGSRFYDEKKR